jgi:hypothetical protein
VDVEAGALLTISNAPSPRPRTTFRTSGDHHRAVTDGVSPRKISGNTLSVIGSSDETSSGDRDRRGQPFAISGNKTLNFTVGIGIRAVREHRRHADHAQPGDRQRPGRHLLVVLAADDTAARCHADNSRIIGNRSSTRARRPRSASR